MYLSIRKKFSISLSITLAWVTTTWAVAVPWIDQLSQVVGPILAHLIVIGIAIIPGAMNAFLVSSLLLDRRPRPSDKVESFPDITILIAAYNEGPNILSTLESISRQEYPGKLKAIVINDGSKDDTSEKVNSVLGTYSWLEFLDFKENQGKAGALNCGLEHVKTDIVITIDGDCYLYKDALKNLVGRYLADPKDTAAVAGAVLVRNSRKNIITKAQEWDYFHGIAAIKRIQSLYQGTLVAQGAFSLYETEVVRKVGGWPKTVGEDIVLTWAILKDGHRVGFAENACLFTNVPETWMQFFRQRQRWSRGLIEAFKAHGSILFMPKYYVLFIWWNLLFPLLDLIYTFAFIPGLILALFGIFWIAGPMTLAVLPLAMLVNYIMFIIQSKMFTEQGLRVRKNIFGFVLYALFYSLILQPACVLGYFKEIVNGAKKNWGTK